MASPSTGACPAPFMSIMLIHCLSGIGLAYSLLARKKGARHVIIADLRLTEDARKAVEADENLSFQSCDVTKWKDLQNIIDTSLQKLGDVPDVYVASAGVFEPVSAPGMELIFDRLYVMEF